MFFSHVPRITQPKNQVPRSQSVTCSLKPKIYQCYIRKKSKNAHKKRKNENFEKQKCVFSSCHKDHSTQKLGSQVKKCALQLVNRQTDGRTDTHELFQDFSIFSFNLCTGSFQLLSDSDSEIRLKGRSTHRKFGITADLSITHDIDRQYTKQKRMKQIYELYHELPCSLTFGHLCVNGFVCMWLQYIIITIVLHNILSTQFDRYSMFRCHLDYIFFFIFPTI